MRRSVLVLDLSASLGGAYLEDAVKTSPAIPVSKYATATIFVKASAPGAGAYFELGYQASADGITWFGDLIFTSPAMPDPIPLSWCYPITTPVAYIRLSLTAKVDIITADAVHLVLKT